MRLRLFDFEEFVRVVKSRDHDKVVAVCVIQRPLDEVFIVAKVIATACCEFIAAENVRIALEHMEKPLVVELEYFKKTVNKYDEDKLKEIDKKVEELKEKLRKYFVVVSGVWDECANG